jgi:peptidoglycan/LPS O-acetylase OafA/YrhL
MQTITESMSSKLESSKIEDKRFLALDALRGIAALTIALAHLGQGAIMKSLSFINFALAVDFFFVLSGFVIALNYQEKLRTQMSTKSFMLLRFGRLYPLHIVTTLCFFLMIYPFHLDATLGQNSAIELTKIYLLNIFNLQGIYMYPNNAVWNVPAWSISVEFFTYIIFALTIKKFRHKLAIILAVALTLSPFVFYTNFLGYELMPSILVRILVPIGRCLAGFALGSIIYNYYKKHYRKLSEQFSKIKIASTIELVVAASIVLFASLVPFPHNYIFAPYIFALSVLVFSVEAGILSKFLKNKFFLLLGTLSYSIYLTHHVFNVFSGSMIRVIRTHVFGVKAAIPAGQAGETVISSVPISFFGDLVCLIGISIVFAISVITYKYIETPSRNYFRKLSQKYM